MDEKTGFLDKIIIKEKIIHSKRIYIKFYRKSKIHSNFLNIKSLILLVQKINSDNLFPFEK